MLQGQIEKKQENYQATIEILRGKLAAQQRAQVASSKA